MHSTNRPQISLVPVRGCGFQDDLHQLLLSQLLEQPGTPTSFLPQQSYGIFSNRPAIKCRPVDPISLSNLPHRQALGNCFNGTFSNFESRVPSLVQLLHASD